MLFSFSQHSHTHPLVFGGSSFFASTTLSPNVNPPLLVSCAPSLLSPNEPIEKPPPPLLPKPPSLPPPPPSPNVNPEDEGAVNPVSALPSPKVNPPPPSPPSLLPPPASTSFVFAGLGTKHVPQLDEEAGFSPTQQAQTHIRPPSFFSGSFFPTLFCAFAGFGTKQIPFEQRNLQKQIFHKDLSLPQLLALAAFSASQQAHTHTSPLGSAVEGALSPNVKPEPELPFEIEKPPSPPLIAAGVNSASL